MPMNRRSSGVPGRCLTLRLSCVCQHPRGRRSSSADWRFPRQAPDL